MPPTRFRVIERDRRLVVVDTLADRATPPIPVAVAMAPALRLSAAQGLLARVPRPRQVRFDGGAVLTTSPAYDDRGPRTLQLSGAAMQLLRLLRGSAITAVVAWIVAAVFFPVLFLAPLLLFTRGMRELLRARATAWLDRWGEPAPKTA